MGGGVEVLLLCTFSFEFVFSDSFGCSRWNGNVSFRDLHVKCTLCYICGPRSL